MRELKTTDVEATEQLLDMRLAATGVPSKSMTDQEKAYRKLLKDNPGKFAETLAALEREHWAKVEAKWEAQEAEAERQRQESGRSEAKPGEAVNDIGTDRAMELIDRLFAQWEAR